MNLIWENIWNMPLIASIEVPDENLLQVVDNLNWEVNKLREVTE